MTDIEKETTDLLQQRINELEGRISLWKTEIDTHQESIDRLKAAIRIDERLIRDCKKQMEEVKK